MTLITRLCVCSLKQLYTPPPFEQWDTTSTALFYQGARIGDLIVVQSSGRYVLVGYNQTGFLLVKTGAGEHLFGRKAPTPALLRSGVPSITHTVPSHYLNKARTRVTPGREFDTFCRSLQLSNVSMYSTAIPSRVFYIVCCPEGHHRVFLAPLEVPTICSEACFDSEQVIIDELLWMVLNKPNQINTSPLSQERIVQTITGYQIALRRKLAFLSEQPIEDMKLSESKVGALRSRHYIPQACVSNWVQPEISLSPPLVEHIKSGQILRYRDYYIRAHRRSCGYLHWEVSTTPVFPATKTIPQFSSQPNIMQCPVCNTPNEYIMQFPEGASLPTSYNTNDLLGRSVDINAPKCLVAVVKNKYPALLVNHKSFDRQTTGLQLIKRSGRQIYLKDAAISQVRPASSALAKKFLAELVDGLGLLRNKPWPRNIIPGSQLRTMDPTTKEYTIVTATTSPYYNKQKDELAVGIVGNTTEVPLKHVLPNIDVPIRIGDKFQRQDNTLTIYSSGEPLMLIDQNKKSHEIPLGEFLIGVYRKELVKQPRCSVDMLQQ